MKIDSASIDDPHDLNRFVDAQEAVFDTALAELKAGHKQGHWIWFVLPQLAGLAASPQSRFYAIASLEDARAYLTHPLLGPRLTACVEAVNSHPHLSAHDIFGSPDDLKFRSCLTLFREAGGPDVFSQALDRFFGGEPDGWTLALLQEGP